MHIIITDVITTNSNRTEKDPIPLMIFPDGRVGEQSSSGMIIMHPSAKAIFIPTKCIECNEYDVYNSPDGDEFTCQKTGQTTDYYGWKEKRMPNCPYTKKKKE